MQWVREQAGFQNFDFLHGRVRCVPTTCLRCNPLLTLRSFLKDSSLMPMFSIGSSTAIPSGNLRCTSSSDFRTVWRCSLDLMSPGRKTRMWLTASRQESRTGTTSILPFSPGPGGRTPGGRCLFACVPGTPPFAMTRRTSTIYDSCGLTSEPAGSLRLGLRGLKLTTTPQPKSISR